MNSTRPSDQFSTKPPRSFLGSCLLGVLAFTLLFGTLEAVFRLNLFPSFLPLRSIGSYHAQFEQKLFKLEDYVKKHGGVDVIILGNSMVNTGIDAARLGYHYQNLTGQKLRIFNFGVEGLTINPISDLAEILVKKFHPGTLIVFTEMRDYVAGNGVDVENTFLDNSWINYEMGQFSLSGVAAEHSLALQHLLSLRNWSRSDFFDSYQSSLVRFNAIAESGYERDMKTVSSEIITRVPDPKDAQDADLFAQFKNFELAPERITALERILSLQTKGTQILVSEIPTYPTYYAYFGSENVRKQYLAELAEIISTSGSTFLPSINESLIPLEGRSDNHHLNLYGAPIYSYLLAGQLVDLCDEQKICLAAAQGVDQP